MQGPSRATAVAVEVESPNVVQPIGAFASLDEQWRTSDLRNYRLDCVWVDETKFALIGVDTIPPLRYDVPHDVEAIARAAGMRRVVLARDATLDVPMPVYVADATTCISTPTKYPRDHDVSDFRDDIKFMPCSIELGIDILREENNQRLRSYMCAGGAALASSRAFSQRSVQAAWTVKVQVELIPRAPDPRLRLR